jgi:Uri superfamily endonuclease
MKGSYVLLINLLSAQTISVGSLEQIYCNAGQYAYVGSAMRGFKSRLPHHFKVNKKSHWHIDHLLQKAQISSVITSESGERNECNIAKTFMNKFPCIAGFGSSDCKCKSHLFFLDNKSRIKLDIVKIVRSLGHPTKIVDHPKKLLN